MESTRYYNDEVNELESRYQSHLINNSLGYKNFILIQARS